MENAGKQRGNLSLRSALVAIAALALAALGVAGTLAFLSSQDAAENDLRIAEALCEVVEDYEPPEALEWDSSFKKDVAVKNTGTCSIWVRAFVEFSNPGAAENCTLDLDTSVWSGKQEDGWYYLLAPLAPDAVSESLFTTVTVGPQPEGAGETGDWASQPGSFDLIVFVECVDAHDHPDSMTAFLDHDAHGVGGAPEDENARTMPLLAASQDLDDTKEAA